MTMTVAQFRGLFPEFSQSADATIQMYLDMAYKMLPADRWADALELGVGFFVAHYLAVRSSAIRNPTALGQGTGIVASKSVDKVSISYDTSGSIYDNAGQWNRTIYGTQFWDLALLFRSGAIQL